MQHLLVLIVVTAVGLPAMVLPGIVHSLLLSAAAGRRSAVLAILGLSAGAAGYAALANRSSRFWRVLHHEGAHVFVALLMLARPTSLVVDGGAGHIKYAIAGPMAGLRSFFIGIAPYCISPVAVISGAVLTLVPARDPWFVLVNSAAIGLGLAATLMEFSPRQPDLSQRGFLFASACALWIWCGVAVVLIGCLSSSPPLAMVANAYQLAGAEFVGWIRLFAEQGKLAKQLLTA